MGALSKSVAIKFLILGALCVQGRESRRTLQVEEDSVVSDYENEPDDDITSDYDPVPPKNYVERPRNGDAMHHVMVSFCTS
jgi:hypothetical protein